MTVTLQQIIALLEAMREEIGDMRVTLIIIRAARPKLRARDMYRWN